MLGKDEEGFPSIVVICIDDGKRLLDCILGTEDSMNGTPRLLAVARKLLLLFSKQGILVLKKIGSIHILCNPVEQTLAEILFDVLANHENHFLKTAFLCVVYPEIEKGFPMSTHAVYLFDPAVAATHTGCQYQ
ncbi:hypothetical protein DSECCO2_616070 [anaerobic digester metagenome]